MTTTTMTMMMIERRERRVSPRVIYRDLSDTTATTTNKKLRVFVLFYIHGVHSSARERERELLL